MAHSATDVAGQPGKRSHLRKRHACGRTIAWCRLIHDGAAPPAVEYRVFTRDLRNASHMERVELPQDSDRCLIARRVLAARAQLRWRVRLLNDEIPTLLATDAAGTPCSCPSGDGSLCWPCAAHPAVAA